ncbi:MAG: tRNA (guanosine(37)-N1)-methyltransferase TrmD [Cyclobacteriaceae bacterium]|nr:tRNA (guanosine(37)-N1)-methyltransferase TrmD [Cyclobacteriaceae bacterium]
MRLDIITCLPELLTSPFAHSILKRAQDKKLVEVNVIDLRDFATNRQKQIDDYQYGGGAGMVMMIDPIARCIDGLKAERSYDDIIYLSPDGEVLTQNLANAYSMKKNLILLCGHYKGVDERVRQHYITKEISIGDFVLSGGELAAVVFADAIIRLIPGVLSDETSALSDSFQDNLIAPPVYTRPADYNGLMVPDVLLSGHAARIDAWRLEQSIIRTKERRPGLWED